MKYVDEKLVPHPNNICNTGLTNSFFNAYVQLHSINLLTVSGIHTLSCFLTAYSSHMHLKIIFECLSVHCCVLASCPLQNLARTAMTCCKPTGTSLFGGAYRRIGCIRLPLIYPYVVYIVFCCAAR